MHMDSWIMNSKFDLNNPYIPIEEEIIGMLDERNDAEPIEEVDNVQIGDVMVGKVGFKDDESAWVTLKWFWNNDLMILHLSSGAFKHFNRK